MYKKCISTASLCGSSAHPPRFQPNQIFNFAIEEFAGEGGNQAGVHCLPLEVFGLNTVLERGGGVDE
jgi:hypothetical protein